MRASSEDRYPRSRVSIRGHEMAYVDTGEGDPIVLLHGNPTSSYLWRNVIPHLTGLGRCIAPDLIGMGESDKLPDPQRGTYSFATHAEFLADLLDEVQATERLTPEAHDRYRAPYPTPGSCWPTLEWPRNIPIEHVPPDVHTAVDAYGEWLASSDVPKLFVDADPGSILVGRQRNLVRRWPVLTEVQVPGSHVVPEDSPDELGTAIADWLRTIP